MLLYTVRAEYDEFLVFVSSTRFPDDTALVAVFKTEDGANEYAFIMNQAHINLRSENTANAGGYNG